MSIKFDRNKITILHYMRTWMAWKAAVYNRSYWQTKVDTLCRDTTTDLDEINKALQRLRQLEATASKLWKRKALIQQQLLQNGITLPPQA